METELGTVEDCSKCNGKGVIVIDICDKCEGSGKIETIQIIKTIKRPYGKCKHPELMLNVSEKRYVILERLENKTNNKENIKGDFANRMIELINNVLDEKEREQHKKSEQTRNNLYNRLNEVFRR